MAIIDGAKGNGRLGKLLPQHLIDLGKSGLSDEQIAACGFGSATDPVRIAALLGWKRPATALGPCLAIPFLGPDGKPNGYWRFKPDKPRNSKKDGKPVKYESPMKKANRAYVPPGTRAAHNDPSVPLIIVEGEKKAAKGDQEGFPSIGLVGTYGWQKKRKNKDAARELIPDLEAVVWKDRDVYLCYDSDLAENPAVAWAEWHLAEVLTAKGSPVKVVRLPASPEGAKVGLDDFLVANGPDAFRKLLEAAEPAKQPQDLRPEIVLGPAEFICVEQAVEALAKKDRELYQRGGQLVRVIRAARPATRQGLTTSGAPRIELLPTAHLRTRLTYVAHLVNIVPKGEGKAVKVPAHPPGWLVQGVDAAGHWPGVRPLEAVVTSPVLLPDGTVLQRSGYHADSGLLYLPEPDAACHPIPERPTHSDAVRACDELLSVVCDFPFSAEEHKAAWLAGVLTPLARFAFHGPAPLFLIDANVRSAGKGLLADTIARIASGREFARAAYTTDDDEMRKVITAIALEGEQLVLLDNLAGVLGNPSLDAALTATEWQGRILGKSKQPRLPLVATWYATGNNVAILADTGRRICHVRLDSPDERPEERSDFQHPDLLKWVRQERERLLAAALTILSAYCRAGRPDQQLKPWGSYEAWTALIRNAVVWVGMSDPGLTRQDFRLHGDREVESLRGLLAGWQEIDPGRDGKTAGQVIGFLKAKGNEERLPQVREVLADLFDLPPGKLPTSGRLGCLLRKFRGRNVGGVCFDSREAHGGVQAWFVRPVGTAGGPNGCAKPSVAGGDGGDGGDVSAVSKNGDGPDPIWEPRENIPTIPTIPTNADIDEGII